MSVKLLRNLVMILPLDEQVGKVGMLHVIGGNDKTAPKQGVVVAVGPGVNDKKGQLVPTEVKPKDRVVYVMNNVQEIKVEGDTLHVLPETEILCKLQ